MNKHTRIHGRECYCILDADPSFIPTPYHLCCDIGNEVNISRFEFIGQGVILKVCGVLQCGKAHKDFYIRRVPIMIQDKQ